ncbi:hypothetical protein Rs2_45754 [Raphanus sativus]|nr:hypothetical protein Rs2_45754 [Raphanus sativus]
MALVMNLLLLLFSVALVRSDETTTSLKSFKIGENVTYDCIDIYKQPGLDHPLLKNHTIQKYKKEFITNGNLFSEKYVHPQSADSPGTHGKDGKGCYNTACSGFVQVSQMIPSSNPLIFRATVYLIYAPSSIRIKIQEIGGLHIWDQMTLRGYRLLAKRVI